MDLLRKLTFLFISVFFFLSFNTAFAIKFPAKPSNGHFIVDQAKIINPAERKDIDELTKKLWKEQKVPIVVVTITSLADQDASNLNVSEYAHQLFNAWGIGSQKRNYGMLLLVSMRDRKARIELGKAWGQGFDRQAQTVMKTLIIPSFKRSHYSFGVLSGVRGLNAMARDLKLPTEPIPPTPWWTYPLLIGLAIGVIAIFVSLYKSGRKGWAWIFLIVMGTLLWFLLRSTASSGFGGGSSGGGGASGSW